MNGQKRLCLEKHLAFQGKSTAHFVAFVADVGGEIEAGGVGQPIESDKRPAFLKRIPNRFFAQIAHEQMRADVAQTVDIGIETHLKNDVA